MLILHWKPPQSIRHFHAHLGRAFVVYLSAEPGRNSIIRPLEEPCRPCLLRLISAHFLGCNMRCRNRNMAFERWQARAAIQELSVTCGALEIAAETKQPGVLLSQIGVC